MAKDWSKVKLLFEHGKSLNEIAKETGFNKGSISKKALKEGWVKQEKATLVEAEVQNIIMQKEIATQKATLGNHELHFHNEEVIKAVDKANVMNMFDNSTIKNQTLINDVQQQIENNNPTEDDIFNLGAISKITETNRKQVLGVTETYKDEKKVDDKRDSKGNLIPIWK